MKEWVMSVRRCFANLYNVVSFHDSIEVVIEGDITLQYCCFIFGRQVAV